MTAEQMRAADALAEAAEALAEADAWAVLARAAEARAWAKRAEQAADHT